MKAIRLVAAMICAGFASGASADGSARMVAPGFCELDGSAAASLPADIVGAAPLVRFASCEELAAWERGERSTFDTFGAVEPLTETGAAQIDGPLRDFTADDVDRQIAIIAAALTEGDRAHLGALDSGGSARLTAQLIRFENAERPHLHVSAVSSGPDGALRRVLVLPYEDGDTLRYMLASMRASLAADRIAMLQVQ